MPTAAKSIRSRTVQWLRERLARDEWQTGAFIPTEEQLVGELRVSRKTVRAALAQLEEEGLLTARRGRGRIVSPAAQTTLRRGMFSRTVVLLTDLPEANDDQYDLRSGCDKAVEIGAGQAIRSAGLHAFVVNPSAVSADGISDLIRERPHGVLVAHGVANTPQGQRLMQSLRAQGVPLVAHGDGAGLADFDRVTADHFKGGYELAKWAIGRGDRRPLRLWGDHVRQSWQDSRDEGHEKALTEAGLVPARPLIIHGYQPRKREPDPINFQARLRELAGYLIEHLTGPEPVDALFLPTDLDVLPAAAACRLLRRTPGVDITVLGFDNIWHNCWERDFEAYLPPVSVEKHNHRLGVAMVELLSNRVQGKLPEQPQRVLVDVEVVDVVTR